MAEGGFDRHASYNNRFRTSSSGSHNGLPSEPQLSSVSEGLDAFLSTPPLQQHSFQPSFYRDFHVPDSASHPDQKMSHQELPNSPVGCKTLQDGFPVDQNEVEISKPMSPGKPRRLSRQTSADAKRKNFAATKTLSGDSGPDDVFVEVDTQSGFYHPASRENVMSTSSTASMLPNPYNSVNHRIHSAIWCCSCLHFVFFCCLPAIYYMEQSDVEFNRDNQKRARDLGRTSSFLFFTGTLVTLSLISLIFFLAIFFSIY